MHTLGPSFRPACFGCFQRSKASPEILPTPLDRALEALSSIKTKRQKLSTLQHRSPSLIPERRRGAFCLSERIDLTGLGLT